MSALKFFFAKQLSLIFDVTRNTKSRLQNIFPDSSKRTLIWIIRCLVVTVGYFIAGKLGIFFAMPSDFATTLWAPSGIALASVLIFGWRILPGVLLGSFLINFSIANSVSDSQAIAILTAAIIGSGASIQASVGAYLICRFSKNSYALSSEKEVFTFFLFSAISTLVNSTIAVTSLVFLNQISHADYWTNWESWWIGDTFGIWIFTPLCLAWGVPASNASWHDRRWKITLPILILLMISAIMIYFEYQRENHQLTNEFNQETIQIKNALDKSIFLNLNILRSLASFYASTTNVEKYQFQNFLNHLQIEKYPSIRAIEWSPIISASNRELFENNIKVMGYPNFQITELNDSKQIVRAANRTDFIPITYVEPYEANKIVHGLDLQSDKTRRETLEQARDTGELTLTPPIILVQEKNIHSGILAILPVYKSNLANASIEQRRNNITGYVIEVFTVDDLIRTVLKDFNSEKFSYRLRDVNALLGEGLFFSSDPISSKSLTDQNSQFFAKHIKFSNTLHMPIGNREWQLDIEPTIEYLATHKSYKTWFVLLMCLLIISITNAFFLVSSGRALHLKQLVDQLKLAKQSAEEANLAKTQFLANMSHEIRTPMNAVLGFCYLLEQKSLDSDSRELVAKIHNAGKSLLAIINNILDFSKIEASRVEIENIPFHLHQMLEHLGSVMQSLAGAKKLELTISPPNDITSLIGDELRLQQVLINLIGNAIKFTEQGEVSLVITLERELDNEIWLRFSVKDSGIGISEEQQAILFEAFSQADTTINRRFGGSGLGLAISQGLVELMGGSLQVNSYPGKGSEFWFEIPFQRTLEKPFHETLSHLDLLIADDNDTARGALHQTVKSLGWNADVVDSGEALIAQTLQRLSHQQSYDVLLVDWMMPQMDGLTAAQKLRDCLERSKQQLKRIPIVLIVTAYSKDQLAGQLGLEAIDGILTKPVTPSSLHDAIARLMSNYKTDHLTNAVVSGNLLAGLRILVVDDSDINQEVAKRILEFEGAIVSLASDGQYAIDWLLAHENQIDLVLMDIQMPRLDGYEATRQIRKLSQFSKLPILALTAGAFRTLQEAALDAGMNDFIAKPFNVDLMLEKIKHWTNHQTNSIPLNANLSQSDQALALPELMPLSPLLTDLPIIPGIDIANALKLWGDIEEFQRYLQRFINLYRTAGQEICDFHEQSNTEAIARLAHKLKGASSSLALTDIPRVCSAIEDNLKRPDLLTDSAHSLQAALDDLHQAIDRWIQKPNESMPGEEDQQLIRDHWATIEPQLFELIKALDEDNPSSAEVILDNLDNQINEFYLTPIKTALTDFNFREAEKLIRNLLSTFTP